MAHFGSWRFSSGASLVAVAVLLCSGAFLSWSATGPELPASLAVGYSSQMGQGTNGQPPNGSYLALPAEESESAEKGPVNAGLLTALLLAFFFGMALGRRFTEARGAECFLPPSDTLLLSFFHRRDPPSLSVFRL